MLPSAVKNCVPRNTSRRATVCTAQSHTAYGHTSANTSIATLGGAATARARVFAAESDHGRSLRFMTHGSASGTEDNSTSRCSIASLGGSVSTTSATELRGVRQPRNQ